MSHATTEPIELPAEYRIEPLAPNASKHNVQRWPTIPRSRDSMLYELDGLPTSRLHIAPKFVQLVLGVFAVRVDETT
jgi:hypothetical protein